MLGRLAARIYGAGRRAYVKSLGVLVAHKILGTGKAKPAKARPPRIRPLKSGRSKSPTSGGSGGQGPRPRRNQTVPPKHTPATKAKFKQANNRV